MGSKYYKLGPLGEKTIAMILFDVSTNYWYISYDNTVDTHVYYQNFTEAKEYLYSLGYKKEGEE